MNSNTVLQRSERKLLDHSAAPGFAIGSLVRRDITIARRKEQDQGQQTQDSFHFHTVQDFVNGIGLTKEKFSIVPQV